MSVNPRLRDFLSPGIEYRGNQDYFTIDIEAATLANRNFRIVLYTTDNEQITLMAIPPGTDIGWEQHDFVDQFIRIEAGQGVALIEEQTIPLDDGDIVEIPMGTLHNIYNVSESEFLLLYSIYSPPNHPVDRVQRTRRDADWDDEQVRRLYETKLDRGMKSYAATQHGRGHNNIDEDDNDNDTDESESESDEC